MSALASIEDVETVTMKSVPADDRARIHRAIEMVSARVRQYTKQQFDEATSTITFYPTTGLVRFPQRPVTAVTALSQVGLVYSSSMFESTPAGYLRRVWPTSTSISYEVFWDDRDWSWGWSRSPLTATYTHGYSPDEMPADIAMVVAQKVAVMWLSGSRDAEGVSAQTIDGYSEGFQRLAHISAGSAWDPEHKEILDVYRGGRRGSVRIG